MGASALCLTYITAIFCASFQLNTIIAVSNNQMQCSSLFCRKTPNDEDSKCAQLLNNTLDCVCTMESLQPVRAKCENFILERACAHVKSDSLWITNRTQLSVDLKSELHSVFEILTDRFFRYLTFTNISDFTFTLFCGMDEVVVDCRKLFFYQTQSGQILKFFPYYEPTSLRSLKLNRGCIQDIEGKFSTVFPNAIDLELRQNHLHSIGDEVFEGLTFIEKLDLSCNKLGDLKNGSIFRGLRSLKHLDLSYNDKIICIRNCFDELVNLQVLRIRNSKLEFTWLNVFKRNTELRLLDLTSCEMESLIIKYGTSKKWLFDGLTKLQILILDNNKITNLPRDVFKSNTNLRSLSLKNNAFIQLSDITQHLNSPILNLDLSMNCFIKVNGTNSIQTQSHKKIKNLTCQSCCLDSWTGGELADRVVLTTDYRTNPIRVITMAFLQKIAHLKKVYLSGDTIKVAADHELYFKVRKEPSQLTVSVALSYPLYIEHNTMNLETQIILSDYTFQKCDFITFMRINWNITQAPNSSLIRSGIKFLPTNVIVANKTYSDVTNALPALEFSKEECNFIYYCPQNCSCHTRGFIPVTVVNCTGRFLTNFPPLHEFRTLVIIDLSHNRIRDFQHVTAHDWSLLVELDLNNNRLEHLENFQIGQNLTLLNLRNNQLNNFSSLGLLLLSEHLIQIMVSQNPWRCDCKTLELKNLMHTRTVDFQEITCTSVYSESVLYLGKASDDDLCPANRMQLKIGLPVFVILVIWLSVSIIMCYRYKDFLKLWLFTRGYCLRWVTEEDIDANKIYDAFVSYSSLDEDWVGTNLVPGLENERPAYKLCLHSRDWPVGDWIIEQIFKSVEESRRTIIVLTQNFVDSMWTRMEFDAAYQQALIDQVNRVLIVVPGDVPDVTKLGDDLKNFVTLNTYIKWKDPFFWRKLRCGMPRVKQQPEAINGQKTTGV